MKRMDHFRRPDLKYVEPPAPILAPMTEVQQYAARASEESGALGVPQLADVVRELGGRVHFVDLDLSDCSGTIYVHGARDFDIVLPEYISPARERFTIAHELGHYALHSRMGQVPIIAPRMPPGKMGERVEWEANWFAAGYLMPEAVFRAAFVEYSGDIRLVASQLRVSLDAATLRAKVLQLLV